MIYRAVGWFRGPSSAAKNFFASFFLGGFGFPSGIQRGQVETLRGDGKTKRPETYGWQVGVEKTTGGVASLRGSDGFGVGLKGYVPVELSQNMCLWNGNVARWWCFNTVDFHLPGWVAPD